MIIVMTKSSRLHEKYTICYTHKALSRLTACSAGEAPGGLTPPTASFCPQFLYCGSQLFHIVCNEYTVALGSN
jgi:hypothetical protein